MEKTIKLKGSNYISLYNNTVVKDYAVKFEKIKEKEKISLLSDSMFKTMFQNESRLQYSCRLFSYLLEGVDYEDLIKNVHLDSNELDKEYEKQKGLRCDYVSSINETKINLEVNNNSSSVTMERNLDYAFRLFASKVQSDTDYDYNQVIQINLNNFAFKGNDKVIDYYYLSNNKDTILTDKIVIVQIYIPNLRKKWYTKGVESLSDIEKYLLVLTEADSGTLNFKKEQFMEEYIKEATKVSHDKVLLEAYDKEWALKDEGFRDGFHDGEKKGFKDGEKKGEKEKQIEIAKNLLKEKMDIKFIAKVTGLSEEELKSLL